jgi:hypothetical protein
MSSQMPFIKMLLVSKISLGIAKYVQDLFLGVRLLTQSVTPTSKEVPVIKGILGSHK